MGDKAKTLQRIVKRLRASGLLWREIGEVFGAGNPGYMCLIASGDWVPTEKRAEEIMRELPRELWKTTKELQSDILYRITTQHVGIESAIKSRYLARQFCTTDRMVRAAINELRKQGHPICSSVGRSSGFYWPDSRFEYDTFKHRDYLSRIKDMQHVVDAMDQGAERHFAGQRIEMELQPELIADYSTSAKEVDFDCKLIRRQNEGRQ